MGLGGICGSYLGARLERHVPEAALRRTLGAVCLLLPPLFGPGGGHRLELAWRTTAVEPRRSSSDRRAQPPATTTRAGRLTRMARRIWSPAPRRPPRTESPSARLGLGHLIV